MRVSLTLIPSSVSQSKLSGAWNPARGACSADGNLIDDNADDSFMLKLISKAESVYVCPYASKCFKKSIKRVLCVGKRSKSYVGMHRCCTLVTKLLLSFEESVPCVKILTEEFSKKHFPEKYKNVNQL